MTVFWKTISLLVLAVLVLTGIQNGNTDITLKLVSGSEVVWPVGLLVLVCAALGAIVVGGLIMPVVSEYRRQMQRTSRSAEKFEVSAESSGEKVKALEAKIQTLEKALDEALARR